MKLSMLGLAILTALTLTGCPKPMKLQKTQVSVVPIGHTHQSAPAVYAPTAIDTQSQTQKQESARAYAPKMQLSWASRYVALLNSGQTTNHPYYQELYETLNQIRLESGATYAYIIVPSQNGLPSITGNPRGEFALTIDGAEEPDEWGELYEFEVQFLEAWQGKPSIARSAWNDDDGQKLWSGFAPIYDQNRRVVALLGIDYPASDIIKKYPQWNRDDKAWNGYTNKIKGKIPPAVQKRMTLIKNIAQKYAKQLSQP